MMFAPPSPASLGLYIHWPFCKAKCPYCDFNSHVREEVDVARWQAALLREMRFMAEGSEHLPLKSIFFGGGTPSLMPPELVAALIEEAARLWPQTQEREITLEANPTSVEAGRFRGYAAAGVNRLSLGIQSLNDEALRFLGREHSSAEARKAIALAADIFPRYSFDLIYALPDQSLADWAQALDEALPLAGDHLSLYQLTIEENTAFHHLYHHKKAFALPEDGLARALFQYTQETLAAAGLPAYEISNHAKPGSECQHNLIYWRGEAYLGVGPGAHGRRYLHGQWQSTITQKSPERWLEQVETQGHGLVEIAIINAEERAAEALLTGLRLREGVTLASVQPVINQKRLAFYVAQELLACTPSHLHATTDGLFVLNELISELLRED